MKKRNLGSTGMSWAHAESGRVNVESIAWVRAQGERIIPIPGTRSLTHLADNLGAVN